MKRTAIFVNLLQQSILQQSILSLFLGLLVVGARPAEAAPFAYVTNVGDGSVSVIDTGSNTVVSSIAVTGPDQLSGNIAVTPDGKNVYVTGSGNIAGSLVGGFVLVIDTASNTLEGIPIMVTDTTWAIWEIAITPDGKFAYVANASFPSINRVSVIDTSSKTVVATAPLPCQPQGIAITPDGKHAYVTQSDAGSCNVVSVIDTASNTVTGAPIGVGSGADSIAITPDGTRAYVLNQMIRTISAIDTESNTVIATIVPPGEPFGIAFGPYGKQAYVTNGISNNIAVIDTASNTINTSFTAGTAQPVGIVITHDRKFGYVTNVTGPGDPGTVSVFDTATNSVIGNPIPVGATPQWIALAPPLPVDLELTKSASANSVVGAPLTYTLTVINHGPTSASGVNVSDTLLASLRLVSATPSQGTCKGSAVVDCSLGSLANGASATVTLVVTPTRAGVINNTATALALEPDPAAANNSATVLTTVTDPTPPFITFAITPSAPDGNNGWYRSNVNVTWSVTDPESSITLKTQCVDTLISTDTAGISLDCTATSAGGSSGPIATPVIKRDATAPQFVSPADLAIQTNSSAGVVVNYTSPSVADAGSGPTQSAAQCAPASGTHFALGVTQVNCTAMDNAGNAAGSSFHVMVRLAPPPVHNRRPVARHDRARTRRGTPVTVNVLANDTDPDGNLDPASVIVVRPPKARKGVVVNNHDGTFTVTPALRFRGEIGFSYRVQDTGKLKSRPAKVTVRVTR